MNRVVADVDAAVADIGDGAILMVGGFGLSGQPVGLLEALLRRGVKELTVISNNAGNGNVGLGALVHAGCVRHIICTFPVAQDMWAFKERYKAGQMELTLVPQGTLAERIRCGGAGLGGVLTPTGVGTEFAAGKPVIEVDGAAYLLEKPLRADFALVHAHTGDRWGNLTFRLAARNFNPLMATAGTVTIAEVEQIVELGAIPADAVHTPGIFVDRVVQAPPRSWAEKGEGADGAEP